MYKARGKAGQRPGLQRERTDPAFGSDVLPSSDVQEVTEVLTDLHVYSDVFSKISERFSSLNEVNKEIEQVVDSPCGLIFGIDYTISNRKQGQKTFGGRNLHHISDETVNPYQEVICILGETMTQIDKRGLIHAFGFGDKSVTDTDIFPLKSEGQCDDFSDVYDTYTSVTGTIKLGGPTNFAPLIQRAMLIAQTSRQFHILIIVADGQVNNEEATTQAIVQASNFPVSIVVIGVGDGPWEVMNDFEAKLPKRRFDNFQFVEFHKIKAEARAPESEIALAALMKIPDQYRAIKKFELLDR